MFKNLLRLDSHAWKRPMNLILSQVIVNLFPIKDRISFYEENDICYYVLRSQPGEHQN